MKDVEDNNFTPLVKSIIEMDESINTNGPPGCGKSILREQIQQN
jgi:ABC-type iron transport system FetAB ATPase subunit